MILLQVSYMATCIYKLNNFLTEIVVFSLSVNCYINLFVGFPERSLYTYSASLLGKNRQTQSEQSGFTFDDVMSGVTNDGMPLNALKTLFIKLWRALLDL